MLLLLGDISFNPGPKNNLQPLHSNKWNAFKSNIKSLFPKIDELRYMANYSNAAVIGISESKPDESVLQSEIQINNYDLLC